MKLILGVRYLEKRERLQLLYFSGLFLFIGLLDLVGIGALAAISYIFLKFDSQQEIILNNLRFDRQTLVTNLVFVAIAVLVLKNFMGLMSTHKFFRILSSIETRLATQTLKLSMNKHPREFLERSRSFLPRALTEEVSSFISGVLGYTVLAFADFALLICMLIAIGVLSPLLLLSIIVSIMFSGFVLQRYVAPLAFRSGLAMNQSRNSASTTILNLGLASKTLWVNSSYGSLLQFFTSQSSKASKANSSTNFSQQLNKYLVEFILLISIGPSYFIITLFSPDDLVAVTISVLFAVTFRILPLLMRLQGSLITIKSSIGNSHNFAQLLQENLSLASQEVIGMSKNHFNFVTVAGNWLMRGINLNYSYTPSEPVLVDFNFEIPRNKLTVVTGSSGVGKTTLIDLILGINSLSSGRIEFNGVSESLHISYMPQEVPIFDLSLIENIALGIRRDQVDIARVAALLNEVGLEKFLSLAHNESSLELDFVRSTYSGGEQQRLGLARALYSGPNLIILDEPTAGLDTESEDNIIDLLKSLSKKCTVVVVSHSTKLTRANDHLINLGVLEDTGRK